MPPVNTMVVQTIWLPRGGRDGTALGQAQRLLARAVQPVEDDMVGKDYVAGEFTAADTMIGHSIMMSHRMGIVDENHPNLMAYIERLNARPALQKAFSFDTI